MPSIITVISRSRAVAITDDGVECPFTDFFDRYGDRCADARQAVTAVCQLPDLSWLVLDLTEFDQVAVH